MILHYDVLILSKINPLIHKNELAGWIIIIIIIVVVIVIFLMDLIVCSIQVKLRYDK